MSEEDEQIDWAKDADQFFTFLGIYVALFQSLEGILDQILLLEAGISKREETLRRIAELTNHDKVDAIPIAAVNLERFPRIEQIEGWPDRVTTLVERLHNERRRRNGLLHSQYWLKGLEPGLSAMRADMRKREGALDFNYEDMDRKCMNEILEKLAALSFDVGQIHIQLVHLCEDG
jgi:hypothetical protein